MRSFEFVEGGSAKFWEIGRDGADVTVRWGRVGTTGQTKVKTFDTEAQAEAHQLKLITEKTRKGYGETTGSSPAPASAPPAPPSPAASPASPSPAASPSLADEDTFVFPAAWNRHRLARHGSTGLVRFTPDPKARATAEEQVNRNPKRIHKIMGSPITEPAIAAAAQAWLDGSAQAPPVGAAAVVAACDVGNWQDREKQVAFADVWIADRGLLFAALAAVELASLILTDNKPTPGARYHAAPDSFGIRHLRPGEFDHGRYIGGQMQIVLRVRAALATAPDDEYAAVVAALAPYRAAGAYTRDATSVLAPTEREWVQQDVDSAVTAADAYRAGLLLHAAGTGEQVTALAGVASAYQVANSLAPLATLVDGVGVAAAPALFAWFDDENGYSDGQRRLLSALAILPGDEVMRGLIERVDVKYVAPALLEAANRYPARALRMLAESPRRGTVADLLRTHVLAHPAVVEQVLPTLTPPAAQRVETVVDAAAAVVQAPPSAVPPLLLDPPWQHRARAVKPVVVDGLSCADAPTLGWLEGEREQWRETSFYRYTRGQKTWEERAKEVAEGRTSWAEPPAFFADAPEEIARPVLATWRSRETWEAGTWMRIVVARFELDALPTVLDLVRRVPADMAPVLAPYASPEIAVLMADWLSRLKSVRRVAQAWLQRHAAAASRALVPPALGKPGLGRRQAEQALLTLHNAGHSDVVREAARGYGAEAAAAIETLLATDPLSVLPAKIPPNPAWATPGLLPPVKLADGSGALPAEAIGNLVTVLAISKSDEPYAGLAIVKQACDPASLAEFGWGLFQRWQASGGNSKEGWVLDTLALIGDDETVRRLTPLILAWPGEGGHTRAVTGVQVLASIGTDVALMHLHGIAQRAKFKGLKAAAGQKMAEVAAELGLSAEQLADRLVPDFGLDADGSVRLDYGPRQFTVGFDEQLRPYVTDAAGKHLKALPKPGVRDDAELAPAAFKQFAALKKDVRTVAADQIRRLERAMVTGRSWTGAEFRQLFVAHPLLWHIVRRLVWGLYDESGALIGAVRVAEDRSFSDVEDEEITLDDEAIVGVAHPLRLGRSLPGWVEIFADYEILQPFPQLSRPTYELTEQEVKTHRLTRFEGRTVTTGKVIGLERRGWVREEPQDAGIQGSISLAVGPKQEVLINLDPGIAIGAMDIFPEQTLATIFLHDGTGSGWGNHHQGRLALSGLDPVAASEIIRDLMEITA